VDTKKTQRLSSSGLRAFVAYAFSTCGILARRTQTPNDQNPTLALNSWTTGRIDAVNAPGSRLPDHMSITASS
jgi:hypothetical protein